MEPDCLRFAGTSIQKLVPGRSKDAQFVPARGGSRGLAIRSGSCSETGAIRSYEAGNVVEPAFGSDFADGFSGRLDEHASVIQAVFEDPVAGSLSGLALEGSFE